MDDNDDKVRIIACDAIALLAYIIDFTKDEKRLSEIIETMLVHLDDNSEQIQNIVFESLVTISKGSQKAQKVINIIQDNKQNHTHIQLCDKLITEIQQYLIVKQ